MDMPRMNRRPTLQYLAFALLALGCKSPGEPVTPSESPTPTPEAPKAEAPTPTAKAPEGEKAPIDLQGAGATFPFPLYSKWVAEYQKVNPNVRINYQSIGSGGGIRQIIERTVDFGATDAPMNDEEMGKAPGKIIHIPTTVGAVVIGYNVEGVTELKLSPDVAAGMFMGAIKKWNDPKIAKLNPGVKLPAEDISVVYRSDGSGTTAVFTEYLSKISPKWKDKVGAGKSVSFPVGQGAKGNEGVAGQLKTSPGTLGYVELAYAKQTNITFATVENAAKKFVAPSLEGITAAASGATANMAEDLRVSIVDAAGEAAYPISSFTYILVYEEQQDAVKGKALAEFLWWAIHDGQQFGPPLDYAKLPAEVVSKVETKLKGLRAGGQQLLAGL
jgi:phosphate transport system substrate-binding protein